MTPPTPQAVEEAKAWFKFDDPCHYHDPINPKGCPTCAAWVLAAALRVAEAERDAQTVRNEALTHALAVEIKGEHAEECDCLDHRRDAEKLISGFKSFNDYCENLFTVSRWKRRAEAAESTAEALRKELAPLKSCYEEMVNGRAQDVHDLCARVEAVKAELAEAEEDCAKLNGAVELAVQMEKERDKARAEVIKIQKYLHSANGSLRQSKAEIAALREQEAEMRRAIQALPLGSTSAYAIRAKMAESRVAALQSRIKDLESHRSSCESEAEALLRTQVAAQAEQIEMMTAWFQREVASCCGDMPLDENCHRCQDLVSICAPTSGHAGEDK